MIKTKPKLYIFVGYPGAGKTTIAQAIQNETGAVHIWADVERHKLFNDPSHSLEESNDLYAKLNNKTNELLSQGRDVIFDTNFNHYKDRQKLRDIAKKNNALSYLIWVKTPLEIAKIRALDGEKIRNQYKLQMSAKQFDSITAKLEPPKDYEKPFIIDGSKDGTKQITNFLASTQH